MKQERAAQLGFTNRHVHLGDDASQADLLAVIRDSNTDPDIDAVLIQHPIPANLDYEAALAELDPDKDADGAHPMNMGRLALGMPGPLPCTPAGIEALLAFYDIPIAGREVVVLGRGFTLGRPLSMLLSLKRPTATLPSPSSTPACPTGTGTHGARRSWSRPPAYPASSSPTTSPPAQSSSEAASGTRARSSSPTWTYGAKRSPAGSHPASAAWAPRRSRCSSATPSKPPSAELQEVASRQGADDNCGSPCYVGE